MGFSLLHWSFIPVETLRESVVDVVNRTVQQTWQLTDIVDLETIFPLEDFRLKMRFERGLPERFYRPGKQADEVLEERRRWLDLAPEVCTAISTEGVPLLAEVIELAAQWGTLPSDHNPASVFQLSPLRQCIWLSQHWETDFLLLRPDTKGIFRLHGGGLCFPSHWDLRSKMVCTVAEIHQPVPGLNSALGRSIDGFLSKIPPGISWERHNWGLTRSPELNQHPSRKLVKLDETVGIDEVWWRLEEQSLVALPRNGGVLFGIRVTVHPLSKARAHPAAREGLRQALETMPDEMALYKGIKRARNRIQELLGNKGSDPVKCLLISYLYPIKAGFQLLESPFGP